MRTLKKEKKSKNNREVINGLDIEITSKMASLYHFIFHSK